MTAISNERLREIEPLEMVTCVAKIKPVEAGGLCIFLSDPDDESACIAFWEKQDADDLHALYAWLGHVLGVQSDAERITELERERDDWRRRASFDEGFAKGLLERLAEVKSAPSQLCVECGDVVIRCGRPPLKES